MRDEIRRTILYAIERTLVRGAHYRFLVVVAGIGLVSIFGGLVLLAGGESTESTGEAIWWAFLRLSDPGYLGDDEGLWRRVVSTLLTVLGYVIFLGAMVAILTQWLNDTLNRLERGLTPIRLSGHVVILGWTNRTRTICAELVMAQGRLDRWLELRGIRRLRIAILARTIGPERDLELRSALGRDYRRHQFVLRSGSSLRARHLKRVDLAHAATIVLPGVESNSNDAPGHDAKVIKTLRAIAAEHRGAETLATCVCEIFDRRRVPVAQLAYGGPLEVLASDVIIGRLLGDSLRQPGSSSVLDELLAHGIGGTLYMRTWHDEACTVGDIVRGTPHAIFVGITTASEFRLAPPDDAVVHTDDALVFVARSYEDTRTSPAPAAPVEAPHSGLTLRSERGGGRVLMLGWSRRMPDLLAQLEDQTSEGWTIHVVSAVDPQKRESDLAEYGVELARTQLSHHQGDLTLPQTLVAAEPAGFDRIFFVASDWPPSGEESDARTITTYLAMRGLIGDRSPMLVELADDRNMDLFDGGATEVVVSPRILSRLLAQVVLRPRLRLVIDEIFGRGRSQLRFCAADQAEPIRFGELAASLRGQGQVAIGIRRGGLGSELLLAPAEDVLVEFDQKDTVIVLDPGSPDDDHPRPE